MRLTRIVVAAGLGLAAACGNFLESPKAINDPNNPTAATRNQLFAGVQANAFANQEGYVPMLVCLWMQQCAGVNSRFVQTQGEYGINPGTLDNTFAGVYTAGGLIGIRAVEASADAAGDHLYKGIAEWYEVENTLFATDNWGDVPYSEAITKPTPVFDAQMSVYDAMLTLLDKAIADIKGGGPGPGPVDLVYSGDVDKWAQAAHTLKARVYLHRVEKLGTGEYTKALAEAKQGISTPANDWLTQHSTANAERNMWQQFQTTSGFGNDLVAGATLVSLMKAQGDPRLPSYFGRAPNGAFGGFDPVTGSTPPDQISPLAGGRASDPAFRQPILTYDENQLIIAESALQTGDKATAATALNAVRSRYSKPAIASPTLADVMAEKYIALFQNMEAFNDYKRTCLPVLKPALGHTRVPGRFFYGQTEVQTNPQPQTVAEDIFGKRNANDPNACQ